MNLKLFFSNLKILLFTLIFFILISIGIFFGYKSSFNDYTYEVKLAQICIDDQFECANASKEFNKFKSFLSNIEIIDKVVRAVNAETGEHYNIQEVQESITVSNEDGYYALKLSSDDVHLISSVANKLITEINSISIVDDKIVYRVIMESLKENISLGGNIQIASVAGSFFGLFLIISRKRTI